MTMGLLDIIQSEIVPSISRFRQLTMCINSTGRYMVAALKLLDYLFMENLEILEIYLKDSERIKHSVFLPIHFKGVTPQLKIVRTDSRILRLTLPEESMSKLEHLQIDEGFSASTLAWRVFPTLLATASSLITLALCGDIFNNPSNSSLDVQLLSLPSLRHFRCMDNTVACNMSQFLHAPLLEQLILHNLDIGMWKWTFRGIPGPLNIFPCIQTVAFINCEMFGLINDPLLALARATSSATHIIIARHSLTTADATSNLVKLMDRRGTLWPRLEELSCFDPWISKEQHARCVDMLSSRVNAQNSKTRKLRVLEQSVKKFRGLAGHNKWACGNVAVESEGWNATLAY